MAFLAPAPVRPTLRTTSFRRQATSNRPHPSHLSLRRPRLTATAATKAAPTSPSAATSRPLDRVVCKFGGSSLANAERLREVTKLVRLQADASSQPPIVVLSAMGPSTNELLDAGRRALVDGVVDMSSIRNRAYEACEALGLPKEELVDPLLLNLDQLLLGVKFIKELSPRTLDYLVSFGERLAVRIFASNLRKNEGVGAMYVDSFEMGFLTDSQFGNAELCTVTQDNIRSFVDKHVGKSKIAVVTGFIAKDADGNITTLGRGGSDLTASTIGAAIGATEVQVWKDVDGILSTDPRIVPGAVPVPCVGFDEAAEMAYFGAKILHPMAMLPARAANVPVRVKNSYNPTHPGTVILAQRDSSIDGGNSGPVTAISVKKSVQLVDICSTRMLGAYGFLSEVFKTFSLHKVSVDVIATSEVSISMTLNESAADEGTREGLVADLGSTATVRFTTGKAIVSLVSHESSSSEIVGRAATCLHKCGIEVQMVSQGASKHNISFIVEENEANTAVRELHKEFFGC